MTANAIIQATADKLTALWPERKVRVNEVPANASGNFFVNVVAPEQDRELDKRRRRGFSVNVIYFEKDHDNMDYNAWAETMFQNFDDLLIDGREIHAKNLHAEQNEREYHFLFDVEFRVLLSDPPGETMLNLDQQGGQ